MHALRSLIIAASAVAAVTAPAVAGAQSAFEGVITFQINVGQAGPGTMQYSIQGGNVRVDMSAGGMDMFTLYNRANKTVDMVMPMRQMYMERSTENAGASADSVAGKTKISWTGKTETIAGYNCEHALITEATGDTTDVCLAKGMGSFVQMGTGMRGRGGMAGGDWADHVGDGFPLKVQRGGRVIMEATKIEPKSLDASIFKLPAGYQKMTLPMRGGGI